MSRSVESAGGRETIAVVDDENFTMRMLSRGKQPEGLVIVDAFRDYPDEIADELARIQTDMVLILDHSLGQWKGPDVLGTISSYQTDIASRLKGVVVWSAYGEAVLKPHYAEHEAVLAVDFVYLRKPHDRRIIAQTVRDILERGRRSAVEAGTIEDEASNDPEKEPEELSKFENFQEMQLEIQDLFVEWTMAVSRCQKAVGEPVDTFLSEHVELIERITNSIHHAMLFSDQHLKSSNNASERIYTHALGNEVTVLLEVFKDLQSTCGLVLEDIIDANRYLDFCLTLMGIGRADTSLQHQKPKSFRQLFENLKMMFDTRNRYAKPVNIALSFHGGNVDVSAVDFEALTMLSINALHNAIAVTGHNGSITEMHFSVREENGEIVFEIQDNGEGVPNPDQFFDGDIEEARSNGNGALHMKALAEQAGGNIAVENDNGAKLIVKLPLAAAAQTA